MPRKKKKPNSAARLREIKEQIMVQQRRALRPALPVNSHAQVSKSRLERERQLARKRTRRGEWDES
jgi:hypothetical protein